MPRIQRITSATILVSLVSLGACADPIMPSGSENKAIVKKQNALIGRTFSLRGGNAFGGGLVSVGYETHSRTTVVAYFVNVTASYNIGTIVPDAVMEEAAETSTQRTGEGLDVAYVNCKTKTYSSLPFPEFKDLSNADRSWFVQGAANKWTFETAVSHGDVKWSIDPSDDAGKELTRFFADLCEATY